MTAKIIYKSDLRTEMTHLSSNTVVETDAPKDNQGKGERFSPTDLVASALASCMLTIMGIASRTHQINIDGAEAHVEKVMVADPLRRIGEIKVHISMPKTHTYTETEKAILEKAAMTCPVFLSLSESVAKTLTWDW